MESKLQQRHLAARRAQCERPSKQRSAGAAAAADARRARRAEAAAAAEEEATRKGWGSNKQKALLETSAGVGSADQSHRSRGDSGRARRGVTFEDEDATVDEVVYAGRQLQQTPSAYDEPYEETYHTAYINGSGSGGGSASIMHGLNVTASGDKDGGEMSPEEEVISEDGGTASGDDVGQDFGANAFDGHL